MHILIYLLPGPVEKCHTDPPENNLTSKCLQTLTSPILSQNYEGFAELGRKFAEVGELVIPALLVKNFVYTIPTVKETKGSENTNRGAEVYLLLIFRSELTPSQEDQIVKDLYDRDWVIINRLLKDASKQFIGMDGSPFIFIDLVMPDPQQILHLLQ